MSGANLELAPRRASEVTDRREVTPRENREVVWLARERGGIGPRSGFDVGRINFLGLVLQRGSHSLPI